jgi:hypothetical protein
VSAVQRAGFNLPQGQVAAPNTPGGAVVVGSNLYTGDGAQGFRHWTPADAANPDPINSGILVFDPTIGYSFGGTGLCLPFCQVGQIAYDGNQTAYLATYDHAKGNGATTPGVWRVSIDPATGQLFGETLLVPNAGLSGNLPTSIAYGPDGNVYVGFLKNDNVVRIVNPTAFPPDPAQVVQSVGKAPNGAQIRAMAFVKGDLYLAETQGLAVIRNAASCTGGCNAVPLAVGFAGVTHVGLTTDGVDRLYVSINNAVWRYTISSGAMKLVATGGTDPSGAALSFLFVKGHTNLLQLDRLGNLWVGDDPSDGTANFSGRIWYISAGALATIP